MKKWSIAVLGAAVGLLTGGGLSGADPYYHMRSAAWTAANWPHLMGFDPFTGFPTGRAAGQFGTPYDLLLATVGLIGGLGDFSAGAWLVYAVPAVLGGLAAVPTYHIALELFDERGAIVAAVGVALAGGVFGHHTGYGFVDHHAAEILLQLIVVALLVNGTRTREPAVLILAGAVTGLYLWVWPPAVYFVVLAAGGLTVASIHDSEVYPPLVYVTPVFFFAAALSEGGMSLTTVSNLHVYACLAGAIGFAVASVFKHRGALYGCTTLAVLGGGSLLALNGLVLKAYSPDATTATIAEAGPPASLLGFLLANFGLLVLPAAYGVYYIAHRRRPSDLLILALAAGTFSLMTARGRMGYYMLPYMAILAAPAAARFADKLLSGVDADRPELARQTIAVVLVAACLLPTGVGVAASGETYQSGWDGATTFLAEETAEPEMDYYGEYNEQDFDYAGQAYGVMAWWDYGHLITYEAQRVPVANPFQQHAHEAAMFFTATNETEEDAALESLGMTEDEEVRYVVVDEATATYKYHALQTWSGRDRPVNATLLGKLYYGQPPDDYELVYESSDGTVKVFTRER